MTRTIPLTAIIAVLLTATLFATVAFAETTKESKLDWKFSEEQLRLFHPPLDADAEKMLDWTGSLESPIPRDTEKWGGHDKYREHVQLMRIMVSRAILATDPPLELESKAWYHLWFPYVLLSKQNQSEWLPKWKAVYDELTELSRKKGDVLDEQTVLYLDVRGRAFFSDILELDKNFLPHGEILLAEIDNFLKKHRELDNLMADINAAKSGVLRAMGTVDEKYQQMLADFRAEMKELVIQNEDRLKMPFWFYLLYPDDPYDTPKKQAEAYRLIEKFQKLIDTNEDTKRFDSEGIQSLYNRQIDLFSSLVRADLANIPKLQTYLDALEKKNDPQLEDILYSGYRTIWASTLQNFRNNGGSDDDLAMIFDGMMKFLDFADNHYDNAGSGLHGMLLFPSSFGKCTPEQQATFILRLRQVIAKMETLEKAWKDAGKRMGQESYVEPLQNYLISLLTQ